MARLDLVWCQPNGYPIDTHVDWEEWKEILGQAGIKDVRLHDARHTAGTLLGELHVDIHVIQRILGHAQVTTTRIYTDPTDPLTREAADASAGCSGRKTTRRLGEVHLPQALKSLRPPTKQ
jgi:site-specific recombinase XerD